MTIGEAVYISESDTKALLSHDDTLKIIEKVCHWQADGLEVATEPRTYSLPLKEFEASYRIKAVALTAIPLVGVRVTGHTTFEGRQGSGAPDNTRYVILSDPRTGRPLAIIDEHWTYNVRTSASGVLGLRYLANPESSVLGLVGAGQLATTCAEMLSQAFPLTDIRVTSRRSESRETFAQKMTDRLKLPVEPKDTVQEVMEGADIIVGCTSSKDPLVREEWLSQGATLCALGAETHPSVYRAVDKVIVSDQDVAMESADVRKLLDNGFFSQSEIWADLPSVVAGRREGRQSPDERILIQASGVVSQDIAVCHFVYEEALRQGRGIQLPVG